MPESGFHVFGSDEATVGADAVRAALPRLFATWNEPHLTGGRLFLEGVHVETVRDGLVAAQGLDVDALAVQRQLQADQ